STLSIAVFFYWLFLSNQDCGLKAYGSFEGVLKSAAEHKQIILSLITALLTIFCGLLLHKTSRAMLKRAWSYFAARILMVVGKSKSAAVFYFRRPLTILAVFALTVFLQLIVITGFWLLGSNMGIEAGIRYYLVFFPMTWVLGALPISVGGAVIVEGGLVTLFTHFAGVSVEKALAIALCQRLVWMLASLPGAIIHLSGAHLPKDFSVDYDKPII
ncbi:MAG: flippase-like domain-containing protein, partial [Planctomycetes bacterium]|nr:flippase-like domain-containing protein [Planctomycetota bacterium]